METGILKSEKDYEAALAELGELFECEDDDVAARDRAELLALLVEKYEAGRYSIPSGSPIDVVRFLMDQHDLDQKDLVDVFGAASRVSDFLRGVRGLSLPTIVALHQKFHVPYEALIDEGAERKPRGIVRKASATRRRAHASHRSARRKK